MIITEEMIFNGVCSLTKMSPSEVENLNIKLFDLYASDVISVFNAMCKIKPIEVPDGWKPVPKEPSTVQWAAGMKAFEAAGVNKVDAIYRAMVGVIPEMLK